MEAMTLIMRNNLFCFGDTFWKQISGVAMGAPPACCIAMIYYFIHESNLLPSFSTELQFYRRYIDNVLGIWYHGTNRALDQTRWAAFKQSTDFGNLQWIVNNPSPSVHFLDLTISKKYNKIITKVYDKPGNPYSYLPGHFCYAPGV